MIARPSTLDAFFDATARQWPDAVAVDVPPGSERLVRETVTYAQLNRQADAIARTLAPLVSKDCIVAILVARTSSHVYAAQLGALKAGAAYTCIDVAFPNDHVRDILSDSGAVALLTDASVLQRINAFECTPPHVIDLDSVRLETDGTMAAGIDRDDVDRSPDPSWIGPQALAYVIYTSGTTGKPKGVMVEHASIVNLVSANLDEFDVGPGDRVGQSSSAAYDSSVEETWLALASGATIVLVDDETTRLGPDLVPWLQRERINVLCPPPTLLRSTACADPEAALPNLRLLYVGGEALPDDVAARWLVGRRLVNGYGPTETTVTAIREQVVDSRAIGIGMPVRGMRAWVLDERGNEPPDGTSGELCLGGAGLARGYRNLPDLNAVKFPQHPRLGRIFRTGDLAHRERGRFFYHGRIDSQVKLRGYRIELEAVEARLAACDGVSHAACTVQGNSTRQRLVAFIVPTDAARPPQYDDLSRALDLVLPLYMVPTRISIMTTLPVTVGGKLDRARLPILEGAGAPERAVIAPRTALEATIAAAVAQVLNENGPISIHDDIFRDLGADSLAAGMLVSHLRQHAETRCIATRDLYEAATVARLAARIDARLGASSTHVEPAAESQVDGHIPASAFSAGLVTTLQGLWLLLELLIGVALAYALTFRVVPWTIGTLGFVTTILLAPIVWGLARLAWVSGSVLLTRMAKALLVGRYHPLRAPAWSGVYLRYWIVQRVARLIPWRILAGTEFLNMALRSLGARVGDRVHIHAGVDLSRGGWDLLDIGDDVTISRDAGIRLVELDRGCIQLGSITIGARSTLDIRAGMASGSSLGCDAALGPWASLRHGSHVPDGECWGGVPAVRVAQTLPPHSIEGRSAALSPLQYAMAREAARAGLWFLLALPIEVLGVLFAAGLGVTTDRALEFVYGGHWGVQGLALTLLAGASAVPATLMLEALAVRCLRPSHEGVMDLRSWAYIRAWLKSHVLESAGTWLSGSVFWPIWLRSAGMRVGPNCEISTIIDTIPDLVTVGSECFLADGIYLAGPRIDRGTVSLGRTVLGSRTFIGNHAVVASGVQLPDDVLLGVCTVADPHAIRENTAWFGHPPLELPRPDAAGVDRRLTHNPTRLRYLNRVTWELLRCLLPSVPIVLGLWWMSLVGAAEGGFSPLMLLLVAAPAASLLVAAVLTAVLLVLKWSLLGRVRPGTHALWSCWCSRWDFLYVAWAVYGRGLLTALEGTLLLSWFLRAMGMTIGRRVLLGYGFAQVVDPDMLVLDDGATVSAMFQAHTFEDRVLKIDRVHVGRGATIGDAAVPLCGCVIGEGTEVAAHSVVMKRERLTPGDRYEGAPTRRV